jgi:hypothetical protein
MDILEEPMLHSAALFPGEKIGISNKTMTPSTPPNVFVSGLLTMKSQSLSGQLNLLISISLWSLLDRRTATRKVNTEEELFEWLQKLGMRFPTPCSNNW